MKVTNSSLVNQISDEKGHTMTLKEYLTLYNPKYYEVHGIKFTPTNDFLFDNFNNFLDDWIEHYHNFTILNIYNDLWFNGLPFKCIYIDNTII